MQKGYEWLWREPGPRMLVEMLKLYGIVETPGAKDNPTILEWGKETGHPEYVHDAIPWCGLTVAVAAKRAGWDCNPKGNALWAENWASWGQKADTPMLGDVLVFGRQGGGHVALYVGEDTTAYHILGGNQGDRVDIERKVKADLLAARRPTWRVAHPASLRVVRLATTGAPLATKLE